MLLLQSEDGHLGEETLRKRHKKQVSPSELTLAFLLSLTTFSLSLL